jgi:micrococcal nuclease
MYDYKCNVVRVVDGDTVDVDIDLGFGIWMRDERVRVMGIDTPESRTRDLVEKQFGLAAKERLKSLLGESSVLRTMVSKSGEDMKGKFGRILGDFDVYDSKTDSWVAATKVMIEEGHAVLYHGQNKDEIADAHLANRERLWEEGVVPRG